MIQDSYCVGIANDPQPEDKLRYFDWSGALHKAILRAELDRNVPIAIWNEKDEIVRLLFLGIEWQKD